MAISQKLLTDGESVVVDTRTHPKALLFPGLVLVLTLAVAIFLDRKISNGIVSLLVWIVALVIVVWWVLRPFLDWLTSTYTVTTRRLITREGVVSRKGHDIPLMRISDVEFDQGLIDRMLGCGTLVISDASTHGSVQLHDIPHVEQVQRQLTDLLSGSSGRTSGGGAGPSAGDGADRPDNDGT